MPRSMISKFGVTVLAIVALPVLLFIVAIADSASAQQTWYFSDIDSGMNDMNGDTVYVMYKGDSDNNVGQYVAIPWFSVRVWAAGSPVAVREVVFDATGSCYWASTIGVRYASPGEYSTQKGGFNPSTNVFYSSSNDGDGDPNKLTLIQGHYLAVQITNQKSLPGNMEVRVEQGLPPPDYGTSLTWSCDDPPYPIPDIGAWIMFSTSAIIIGLVSYKIRKQLRYCNSCY